MSRNVKLLWFDVETTGLDHKIHDIIEFALLIEIDGEVKEEKVWKPRPLNFDSISEEALRINKQSIEELKQRELTQKQFIKELIQILDKYVDRNNKWDFINPAGHNVAFDVNFLKTTFQKIGLSDKVYESYFNHHNLDTATFAIAAHYVNRNWKACFYSLAKTAEAFGVDVDEDQAHGALYDIKMTRDLFLKTIGKE